MMMRRSLLAVAVALSLVSACKPGTSVGSPAPGSAPTPTASAPAAPRLPAGVTDAMVAEGGTLFNTEPVNCARCHGVGGKGGQRGPNLTDSAWVQINGSYPEIVRIITTGVPATSVKGPYQNGMRAKGGVAALTEAQINSIAAFIYAESRK